MTRPDAIAATEARSVNADPVGERPLWWRLMDIRVGVAPLPLVLILLVLIGAFARLGEAPSDLPMNIALLAVGGFLCAEVGARMPGLRGIGLGAVLAAFVPSWLVYEGRLPAPLVTSITRFVEQSNILYLFIASIVVGSILGMDRRMLVSGFLKIALPLGLGSIAAAVVGCAVGTALGLGFRHTLFWIVGPIMAGGVGEGAIPLSLGYAQITRLPQGDYFAEILPAVILGSLTAVVISGGLNLLGRRRPDLTGEGRLERSATAGSDTHGPDQEATPGVQAVGGAVVLVATLFLAGSLAQKLWGWPGPVVMLALAVVVKLGRLAPPMLERGAYANYRFFSVCVTYPLLFAIGVAKTPWEKLVAAFNLPTLATIVATVTTLVATGFFTARWAGLHPIDAAVVTACHSGQGGTGDVAILTAANRLQLMPFAQIATRIGGAINVTLILMAFARLEGA